jgi:NarL family two-component system response regulator LiaR
VARISVLIVDDHGIVRQGLRTYLDLLDDIEVIGEAENGVEAVAQVRQHRPDVVLMDLVMPEMDGIEATRQVGAISPITKVIVLTSFMEDEMVFPAIKAGAAGYLLKDVSPSDLAGAIQAVHEGETRLHPEITKKLVNQFVSPQAEPTTTPAELTPRELEVLRLLAQGMSNRELAQMLVISEKTVKTHVSNILSKLHLADRTQAAIYAYKHGLVPGD